MSTATEESQSQTGKSPGTMIADLSTFDTVGEFRIGKFLQHCSHKEVGHI
jgi:hypothetical protein